MIVNGTYPNYGWLLKIATEDATQQYWAYYSKESATAAYRPFLRIRYSGCSVLPIELLDFKAVLKNNQVALSWQTASETNNDFFTIERSEDAVNWMETQHIKGAGNSKILLSYAFTDEHPFAETTYYRLKQTDFDGKFSYSAVQSLTIHDPEKSKIFIYPNPAEDEVRIRTTDSDCSQLKIYDVYGRDMTVQITITTSDSSLCTLHLQNLKPGIYSIHTSATCSKLVKQ